MLENRKQMYIRVEVTAGAKKEVVTETGPDSLEIFVREPAERNLANERVLEIIRRRFSSVGRQVRIISGHHSPRKIFSVD